MFIGARELIDDTIDRLEKVSELLADEYADQAELTLGARTCKEAVQTIKVLIPKLHQARATQISEGQLCLPQCVNCD